MAHRQTLQAPHSVSRKGGQFASGLGGCGRIEWSVQMNDCRSKQALTLEGHGIFRRRRRDLGYQRVTGLRGKPASRAERIGLD